jgi:TatD DNase family protein
VAEPAASELAWELADSHVHLDRYRSREVDAMLTRARRAGVRRFLAIGVDQATSEAAVTLAGRRGVGAAVGLHPTRVERRASADLPTWLRALARRPGVVALGEVGLDANGSTPLATQEAFLLGCIQLARAHQLPLCLHVVGAHEQAQALLRAEPPPAAVVHYFQGDPSLARAYLDLDFYISVGKPVTRPERAEVREAVREIPLDRLLLETDTYPLPGRTTEPADVALIAQAIADLRGVSVGTVARATTANYRRLFGS